MSEKLQKEGLSWEHKPPRTVAALLRRDGGSNYGRRGTLYWLRVWAVHLEGMNYAIYRQVGANRKNSRPRIMRLGVAVCRDWRQRMTDQIASAPELIRSFCRYYGISNPHDAMWMEEFAWGPGRFDILSIDLSNWTVRGFEIKIRRGDFLQDRKWQNYLPYVNLFYFATVPGVINAHELPPDVGLLELSDKGFSVRQRAKKLQPAFVRHTFGEQFITKILLNFIRNINWRQGRIFVECPKCHQRMQVTDGRCSPAGVPIIGDLP